LSISSVPSGRVTALRKHCTAPRHPPLQLWALAPQDPLPPSAQGQVLGALGTLPTTGAGGTLRLPGCPTTQHGGGGGGEVLPGCFLGKLEGDHPPAPAPTEVSSLRMSLLPGTGPSIQTVAHKGRNALKKVPAWGAWVAGHDPRVLGSSPASGSLLGRKPASPSPIPPACVPAVALSLSVSNKLKSFSKK